MDETALRLGIGELIAAYADCIDDDRLEEWPDFFVENCRYLITSRESHAAGLRHGIIYCASRGMLIDRVMAIRRKHGLEGAQETEQRDWWPDFCEQVLGYRPAPLAAEVYYTWSTETD